MLEMEIDDDFEQSTWNAFPAEILINVFKYLDVTDLLACRSVSASWRANADYLGEKSGIWLQLVNKLHNKGYNARQRTTLDYTSLYLNYYMWYAVKNAQVTLKYVYNLKEIRNIRVYRDNLFVVLEHCVKFFNLETGKITKEMHKACLDYQETDSWLVKVNLKGGKKNHILYSKRKNSAFQTLGFGIYSVHHNKCHVSTWNNIIDYYECTPKGVDKRSLGRYYSGRHIRCLHMYDDDLYVYGYKGDVFHRKSGELNLTKVCILDVPLTGFWETPKEGFRAMFHKISVVYGVDSLEKEGIKRHSDIYGKEQSLTLFYYGLTCAVPHDDILLLGFEDGKVGVVVIKNLWITNDLTPDFQFYIHEVAAAPQVEAINFLEVYEGDSCHHVIVATQSNLYQVVISHADFTKVMH